MYSELIAQADDTLADSQRICAQSVALRVQTNALLLTYRAHRFPHCSGANGDVDRGAMIRSKIGVGALPWPGATREKCWVGKGTNRPCHGCGVPVAPEELEYELDVVGGETLLFDAKCLAAWNELRAARTTV